MGCIIRSFYLLFLLLGLWISGRLAVNLLWIGPIASEWWIYWVGGFATLAVLCIYYFFVNFVGKDDDESDPPQSAS